MRSTSPDHTRSRSNSPVKTAETRTLSMDSDSTSDDEREAERRPARPRGEYRKSFSLAPRVGGTGNGKRTRLLSRRDGKYSGAWNILIRGKHKDHCHDPFHSLIAMTMPSLMFTLSCLYFVLWTVFAPIYMAFSDRCQLACDNFLDALYFSMVTMTTIGYGTDSMTFNDCHATFWIIGLQFILGSLVNALLLGLLFTRFSRSMTRASSIVFSNTAVIRQIRGDFHFMFQIVDRRKYSLNEAHVRVYAIRHSTNPGEPYLFQQFFMRLSHPDDQVGGVIFMCLPTLVVHPVDAWSPLCPPRDADTDTPYTCMSDYEFPDVLCRANDAEAGGRSAAKCEICGESYGSPEDLKLHLLASAVDDRISGHDVRCVTADSGEVFASVDNMMHYCKEEDREPFTTVSVNDQRKHSHLNHLCAASYYTHLNPLNDDFGKEGRDAPGICAGELEGSEGSEEEEEDLCKTCGNEPAEKCTTCGSEKKEAFGYTAKHANSAPHKCMAPVNRPDLVARERAQDKARMEHFLQASCMEIIVLVEGVDPYTSSTVQARHSFCYNEGEIKFDHMYGQCVGANDDGIAVIDMEKFHSVIPCTDVAVARTLVAHA